MKCEKRQSGARKKWTREWKKREIRCPVRNAETRRRRAKTATGATATDQELWQSGAVKWEQKLKELHVPPLEVKSDMLIVCLFQLPCREFSWRSRTSLRPTSTAMRWNAHFPIFRQKSANHQELSQEERQAKRKNPSLTYLNVSLMLQGLKLRTMPYSASSTLISIGEAEYFVILQVKFLSKQQKPKIKYNFKYRPPME